MHSLLYYINTLIFRKTLFIFYIIYWFTWLGDYFWSSFYFITNFCKALFDTPLCENVSLRLVKNIYNCMLLHHSSKNKVYWLILHMKDHSILCQWKGFPHQFISGSVAYLSTYNITVVWACDQAGPNPIWYT